MFFILVVDHFDPILVQIGPKIAIFKRFYQFFFRTTELQHKLLILIESPSIFHAKLGPVLWKKQRNWHFNRFFHVFA